MNTPIQNFNSLNNSISFKGKAPNIDDLTVAKRFANCALDKLEKRLINSVEQKAPNLVQSIEGQKYIPNDTASKKAVGVVKSLFSMPIDIVDSIAKKFPNSSLNNSEFLKNHRDAVELDNKIKTIQGIQENSLKYVKEVMDEKGLKDYPTGECNNYCKSICDPVTEKFYKNLNKTMADDVANYDTKKERFVTRLVSGFTAAFFLGNDFFNKAIKKGKTEKEAVKEQHLKQGQEIKENICEAITQFAVFACFSKAINKSAWAPALLGAGIGLVSRVISRLTSGMKITRMKAPKQNKLSNITLDEFANCAKTGEIEEILNKKQENDSSKENKTKNHLLSIKNIILFCSLSILGGYSSRFLKGHTAIGEKISQMVQNHKSKIRPQIIEEKFASVDDLIKMGIALKANKNKQLGDNILEIAKKADKSGKVNLGTAYKTTKIFGMEVKVKDLKALKTAPFRFVKEIVSYPYKIVHKLEESIKKSHIIKQGGKIPKPPSETKDIYNIQNLYKRFMEFEAKYENDEAKLNKEFGNYVNKMLMCSNNNVTSSSFDNSKIAVLAQTLGTLTGMWFNMNDEFNSSIRNGSTKSQAEKDARLRGINKFFRMTVQIVIAGSLNNVFKKQYNSSLMSSAIIVAVSTILTDMASRVLSGMPSKKMSKDELKEYESKHKQGVMSGYYNMIDKLAS